MVNLARTVSIIVGLLFFSSPMIFGQNYFWPLKIEPRLSSQFGDYRAGHWHAGLDITTRGNPGYKVYAVADGYIFRVRTSYWGYGNALYLKLDDGNFAVYGHLTRFNKQMDDYVHRRQMETNQYYQDLFFGPDQYRVRKGDYIALSGQTGSGAPHLHLEIRDPNNLPLNPLRGFYSLDDGRSPVIDYLVVKHYKNAGPGNYHQLEFLNLDGRRPFYSVRDTIAVYGQCALAVAGYDPDNSYFYGLFGASLTLDGNEIFGFKNERMDYSTGYQIDYVRDLTLKRLVESIYGIKNDNDRNVFYRLYVQPGDRQLFYGEKGYPSGIIFADSLDDSVHDLRILVADNNDNISEIQLFIKKAALPAPEIEYLIVVDDTLTIKSNAIAQESLIKLQKRRHEADIYNAVEIMNDSFEGNASGLMDGKDYQYRLRLENQNQDFSPWIEFKLNVNGEEVRPFADYLDIIVSDEEALRVNNISLDEFYALPLPGGFYKARVPVPVTNGYFEVSLKDIQPSPGYYVLSSTGAVFSPDSSVKLDVRSQHLYGPALVLVSSPTQVINGYEFNIYPADLLFAGSVNIQVDHHLLNLDPAKSSLYYYLSPVSRWIYIGGNSPASIAGETGGGGRFGILQDVRGPMISRVKPSDGGTISDRMPYLTCRISDDLAGIKNENQLEMTIDDIWVPAYYDIDSREFSYQVKNPLKTTRHTLRIRAVDNQGNESVSVSQFTIR